MTKITVSLTGHRPDKLGGYNLDTPYYDLLRKKLTSLLETYVEKYDHVEAHSGMALGADTVWAQVILATRSKYPEKVTFVADIPDYNQSSRWFAKKDVDFWKHAVGSADKVNTYVESGKSYGQILQLRNIGMINPADELIAIYNGDATGGTANAVNYGRKKHKKIVQIDPDDVKRALITGEDLKHVIFENKVATPSPKPINNSFVIRQR